MQKLKIGDVEVAICDTPEERGLPPALLIHGIPDTMTLWSDTVERLRGKRRAILVDLPGFGASPPPPHTFGWSMASRANLCAGILNALEVTKPVALIAHDAGGTFGAAFCAAYPERVERALFVVTTIHPEQTWHRAARLYRTPVVGELVMALASSKRIKSSLRRFSGGGLSDQYLDDVVAAISPSTKRAILAFYRATSPSTMVGWQRDLENALSRKPVRVVWGAENPGGGPDLGAKSFPGAVMTVFENVGHWPMIENPERWGEELNAFLDQDSGDLDVPSVRPASSREKTVWT